MTDEQKQKRAWLSRAKTAEQYMIALEKQIKKDNRLIAFLSEFDDPDVPELKEKVTHSIQEQRTQVEELIAIRDEIKKAILKVHDDKLQTVLTRHYLLYETIETVAENMDCDIRTIQRNHKKALDKIVMHKVKGESVE